MRALTLTQPWASAVAIGSKRIETRSWSTSYRGRIAIHAAKGYNRGEMLYLESCWNWIGAMWETGVRMGDGPSFFDVLPFGAIVAVATIADCRSTGDITQRELDTARHPAGEFGHLYKWTERQMGDYSIGRYAFTLMDVVRLRTPVPCKGALGLWTVPQEIETRVMLEAA